MPYADGHLDPDQLALLAMGEPVSSRADSQHLAGCPACASELQELARAVQVGRATIDLGELETPAPAVWTRISQELQLSSPPADRPPERPTQAAYVGAGRSRLRTFWSLAAAIVLLAGIGLGGWMLGQRSALVPVAQAALEPFPAHPGAVGSAVVEQKQDGEQVVRVTLDASGAPNTYREVWLISADASALISLGVLDGGRGTFPIPVGVDLRNYVLVDISQQKIDGKPSHSGDSIVRGQLSFDAPPGL